MILKQLILACAFISGLGIILSSCNSQTRKDTQIKAQIEADLSKDVTVDVKDGIAIFRGTFKDEIRRDAVIEDSKNIPSVKSVVDSTVVEVPVTVDPNEILDSSVSSVVSAYEGVFSQVQDSTIALTGTISESDLPRLMESLNSLKPKKIDNNLLVK